MTRMISMEEWRRARARRMAAEEWRKGEGSDRRQLAWMAGMVAALFAAVLGRGLGLW